MMILVRNMIGNVKNLRGRAFEYIAFTLVAILSESDGDSQSLEA